MEEKIWPAKKTFSRIGLVYVIFYVAVFIVQVLLSLWAYFSDSKFYSDYNFYMLITMAPMYIGGMLILCPGSRWSNPEKTAVPKRSMKVSEWIQAAFMSYALLFVTNLLGTFVNEWIGRIIQKPIENPLEWMMGSLNPFVLIFFTVICAPIFEELFFRKFIVERTLAYGEGVAIFISGLFFALFHGNLSQIPYAFTLGCFFAYIYLRTGKLVYTVLLHAFVNFIGSAAGLLMYQYMDLNALLDSIESLATDELIGFIISHRAEFAIFMVYEIVVFLLTIIGIILWIMKSRKFKIVSHEQDIPKGSRAKTIFLNPGMIVYLVIMIGMVLFNTLAS